MDEGTSSSQALNAFNREVATQRAFSQHLMIRDIVDYVPDSEPGGPMMVLRFHTETLREARHIRPLTLKEIKWIMSGVLLGIYAVHIKGVVYTDLRMENILISGLNHEEPNTDVRKIIVRLADCGSIRTASSKDIITSLPYRSPEVHFGKRWAQSTDVWSWGILLAQLLQAQVDFKSPGMYESLYEGSLEEQTVAVRDKLSIDFKLSLVPMYAEDEHTAKLLPPPQPEEAYKWTKNLSKKGVADEDLQFLLRVLHPDPKARLSIREILQSRYLD
ncbi:hypothetical protein FQN57_002479 [Myotisia sp. PD_48]|nr:hypothetical protein FQN57_002479 [Myotisia sp. PD_48]